jgi:hypothetical protein
MFRVVTRDHSTNDIQHYTVWIEGTRSKCLKWILARYRHIPPFVAITKRKDNFDRIRF